MNVIITEWALQSYLNLKHRKVFTRQDYKTILRPDAELLKNDFPQHQKFQNNKFWGPAVGLGGTVVTDGFKMKWHNFGPKKVQLRLQVAICNGEAFLCEAYVKTNDKVDKRYIAKLKNRIRDINQGKFKHRGYL